MVTGITAGQAERGEITTLALALEIAMLCDADARARYLAIWGEEWQPLCNADGTEIVRATMTAKTVR